MPDVNDRVVALLEQLVELQRVANARQEQALAAAERQYAESRLRSEEAIGLQKTAVARQRWFVRAWLGLIVVVFAAIAAVLILIAPYLH